jgi:hypothetical protein
MKKHRFSGKPEVLFNKEKNILVLRNSEFLFEALYLDDPNQNYWQLHAFKPSFTFDFFNGSNYLVQKGFNLVERL